MKRTTISFLLAFWMVAAIVCPPAALSAPNAIGSDRPVAENDRSWMRTELYFGRNIGNDRKVSDEDWAKFVEEIITPRFPNGITVIDGDGQFRGSDGTIVREKNKILILIYLRKERKAAGVKIEEIRSEYKRRFSQESVLRVNFSRGFEVQF